MSLVRLGGKPPAEPSPANLILECHERIRTFSALAVRLAAEDAPLSELSDAASRVHRYFTQALPLHVADEERSLAPRLRRYAPEAAEALFAMEREHREHEKLLAELIPAWDELRSQPEGRHRTLGAATKLRAELEAHLASEERAVVPALAALPEAEARAVLAELKARRSR